MSPIEKKILFNYWNSNNFTGIPNVIRNHKCIKLAEKVNKLRIFHTSRFIQFTLSNSSLCPCLYLLS